MKDKTVELEIEGGTAGDVYISGRKGTKAIRQPPGRSLADLAEERKTAARKGQKAGQ